MVERLIKLKKRRKSTKMKTGNSNHPGGLVTPRGNIFDKIDITPFNNTKLAVNIAPETAINLDPGQTDILVQRGYMTEIKPENASRQPLHRRGGSEQGPRAAKIRELSLPSKKHPKPGTPGISINEVETMIQQPLLVHQEKLRPQTQRHTSTMTPIRFQRPPKPQHLQNTLNQQNLSTIELAASQQLAEASQFKRNLRRKLMGRRGSLGGENRVELIQTAPNTFQQVYRRSEMQGRVSAPTGAQRRHSVGSGRGFHTIHHSVQNSPHLVHLVNPAVAANSQSVLLSTPVPVVAPQLAIQTQIGQNPNSAKFVIPGHTTAPGVIGHQIQLQGPGLPALQRFSLTNQAVGAQIGQSEFQRQRRSESLNSTVGRSRRERQMLFKDENFLNPNWMIQKKEEIEKLKFAKNELLVQNQDSGATPGGSLKAREFQERVTPPPAPMKSPSQAQGSEHHLQHIMLVAGPGSSQIRSPRVDTGGAQYQKRKNHPKPPQNLPKPPKQVTLKPGGLERLLRGMAPQPPKPPLPEHAQEPQNLESEPQNPKNSPTSPNKQIEQKPPETAQTAEYMIRAEKYKQALTQYVAKYKQLRYDYDIVLNKFKEGQKAVQELSVKLEGSRQISESLKTELIEKSRLLQQQAAPGAVYSAEVYQGLVKQLEEAKLEKTSLLQVIQAQKLALSDQAALEGRNGQISDFGQKSQNLASLEALLETERAERLRVVSDNKELSEVLLKMKESMKNLQNTIEAQSGRIGELSEQNRLLTAETLQNTSASKSGSRRTPQNSSPAKNPKDEKLAFLGAGVHYKIEEMVGEEDEESLTAPKTSRHTRNASQNEIESIEVYFKAQLKLKELEIERLTEELNEAKTSNYSSEKFQEEVEFLKEVNIKSYQLSKEDFLEKMAELRLENRRLIEEREGALGNLKLVEQVSLGAREVSIQVERENELLRERILRVEEDNRGLGERLERVIGLKVEVETQFKRFKQKNGLMGNVGDSVYEGLQKRNGELEEVLRGVRGELEAARREVEAKNRVLGEKCDELELKKKEVLGVREGLQSAKKELEGRNVLLQELNNELEAKNQELQARNSELEKLGLEQEKRNTELQRANSELTSTKMALESTITELERQNEGLQVENSDSQTARVELKKLTQELETELQATSEHTRALSTELESARNELKCQAAAHIQHIQNLQNQFQTEKMAIEHEKASVEKLAETLKDDNTEILAQLQARREELVDLYETKSEARKEADESNRQLLRLETAHMKLVKAHERLRKRHQRLLEAGASKPSIQPSRSKFRSEEEEGDSLASGRVEGDQLRLAAKKKRVKSSVRLMNEKKELLEAIKEIKREMKSNKQEITKMIKTYNKGGDLNPQDTPKTPRNRKNSRNEFFAEIDEEDKNNLIEYQERAPRERRDRPRPPEGSTNSIEVRKSEKSGSEEESHTYPHNTINPVNLDKNDLVLWESFKKTMLAHQFKLENQSTPMMVTQKMSRKVLERHKRTNTLVTKYLAQPEDGQKFENEAQNGDSGPRGSAGQIGHFESLDGSGGGRGVREVRNNTSEASPRRSVEFQPFVGIGSKEEFEVYKSLRKASQRKLRNAGTDKSPPAQVIIEEDQNAGRSTERDKIEKFKKFEKSKKYKLEKAPHRYLDSEKDIHSVRPEDYDDEQLAISRRFADMVPNMIVTECNSVRNTIAPSGQFQAPGGGRRASFEGEVVEKMLREIERLKKENRSLRRNSLKRDGSEGLERDGGAGEPGEGGEVALGGGFDEKIPIFGNGALENFSSHFSGEEASEAVSGERMDSGERHEASSDQNLIVRGQNNFNSSFDEMAVKSRTSRSKRFVGGRGFESGTSGVFGGGLSSQKTGFGAQRGPATTSRNRSSRQDTGSKKGTKRTQSRAERTNPQKSYKSSRKTKKTTKRGSGPDSQNIQNLSSSRSFRGQTANKRDSSDPESSSGRQILTERHKNPKKRKTKNRQNWSPQTLSKDDETPREVQTPRDGDETLQERAFMMFAKDTFKKKGQETPVIRAGTSDSYVGGGAFGSKNTHLQLLDSESRPTGSGFQGKIGNRLYRRRSSKLAENIDLGVNDGSNEGSYGLGVADSDSNLPKTSQKVRSSNRQISQKNHSKKSSVSRKGSNRSRNRPSDHISVKNAPSIAQKVSEGSKLKSAENRQKSTQNRLPGSELAQRREATIPSSGPTTVIRKNSSQVLREQNSEYSGIMLRDRPGAAIVVRGADEGESHHSESVSTPQKPNEGGEVSGGRGRQQSFSMGFQEFGGGSESQRRTVNHLQSSPGDFGSGQSQNGQNDPYAQNERSSKKTGSDRHRKSHSRSSHQHYTPEAPSFTQEDSRKAQIGYNLESGPIDPQTNPDPSEPSEHPLTHQQQPQAPPNQAQYAQSSKNTPTKNQHKESLNANTSVTYGEDKNSYIKMNDYSKGSYNSGHETNQNYNSGLVAFPAENLPPALRKGSQSMQKIFLKKGFSLDLQQKGQQSAQNSQTAKTAENQVQGPDQHQLSFNSPPLVPTDPPTQIEEERVVDYFEDKLKEILGGFEARMSENELLFQMLFEREEIDIEDVEGMIENLENERDIVMNQIGALYAEIEEEDGEVSEVDQGLFESHREYYHAKIQEMESELVYLRDSLLKLYEEQQRVGDAGVGVGGGLGESADEQYITMM